MGHELSLPPCLLLAQWTVSCSTMPGTAQAGSRAGGAPRGAAPFTHRPEPCRRCGRWPIASGISTATGARIGRDSPSLHLRSLRPNQRCPRRSRESTNRHRSPPNPPKARLPPTAGCCWQVSSRLSPQAPLSRSLRRHLRPSQLPLQRASPLRWKRRQIGELFGRHALEVGSFRVLGRRDDHVQVDADQVSGVARAEKGTSAPTAAFRP